jgi:hypothetical protein
LGELGNLEVATANATAKRMPHFLVIGQGDIWLTMSNAESHLET